MISLKECERILRANGFVFSEDLDLKELRAFLYQLAELQIEEEELCIKDARERGHPPLHEGQ